MGSEKLLRLVSRTRPDPDVEPVRTRVESVVDVGRRAMADSTGAMVLPDVRRWRDAAPELVEQLEQPARAAMTFVQQLESGMASLPGTLRAVAADEIEAPFDLPALPRLARGTTPPTSGEPVVERLARGSAPQLFAEPSGAMALPFAEQVASPLAALEELARGRAPHLAGDRPSAMGSTSTTTAAVGATSAATAPESRNRPARMRSERCEPVLRLWSL